MITYENIEAKRTRSINEVVTSMEKTNEKTTERLQKINANLLKIGHSLTKELKKRGEALFQKRLCIYSDGGIAIFGWGH